MKVVPKGVFHTSGDHSSGCGIATAKGTFGCPVPLATVLPCLVIVTVT
eukprot:COSAG06_NODE_29346_length_558_cov_0.962963_1_plen_47_part_01